MVTWVKENIPFLERFASLVPTLILSLFNAAIPNFTKLVVTFEKWDFPETRNKNEIWRNFFVQLTTLMILM